MPADVKLSSINNSNIKSKLLQKDDFELPSPGVKEAKASTTQIEVINNYNNSNNNNYNNNKEDNNIKIDEFDDQFDH